VGGAHRHHFSCGNRRAQDAQGLSRCEARLEGIGFRMEVQKYLFYLSVAQWRRAASRGTEQWLLREHESYRLLTGHDIQSTGRDTTPGLPGVYQVRWRSVCRVLSMISMYR
jgi:hypothetical protein